jgi:hypothetical protein
MLIPKACQFEDGDLRGILFRAIQSPQKYILQKHAISGAKNPSL